MRTSQLSLVLALASGLHAQTIDREITYSATAFDTATIPPQVGSQFFTSGAVATSVVTFPLPENESGVEHTQAAITAKIASSYKIELMALDDRDTFFEGTSFFGSVACGPFTFELPFCAWGISDPIDSLGPIGGNGVPYGAGEIAQYEGFNGTCFPPCNLSLVIMPDNPTWGGMLEFKELRVRSSMTDVSMLSTDAASQPLDCELRSFVVRASTSATVTHTFRLRQAPLNEYCSSPIGSSGVPTTLEAYGSQQAGTEYLTARVGGLPDAVPTFLFVGTAAARTPLGSSSLTLCLGGSVRPSGYQLSANGQADFNLDLNAFAPGDRVYLQAFYRDTAGLSWAASNASVFEAQPPN